MLTAQQFIEKPNEFLIKLIRNQPDSSIKGIPALLYELTNHNRAAAGMLESIIFWSKHSVLNLWVFKTAQDWWNERRISRDQRDRVHSSGILQTLGIERRKRQVAGKGTPMHYRLNWKQFLKALAQFFSTTIKQIVAWMTKTSASDTADSPSQENRSGESAKPEMQNKKPNKSTQQNNVIVEISSIIPGMKLELATYYINKYGIERVQQMVVHAQRKQAKNIAGFVRNGLENNWIVPLVETKKQPKGKKEYDENYREICDQQDFASGKYADYINQDDDLASSREVADEPEIVYENPKLKRNHIKSDRSWTARDAWNAAYNQLELQLDRVSFDTWVRPARFVGVDNGVWVIHVHNHYAQDMLQGRLYRNIRRVVGDIAAISNLELQFQTTSSR